MPKLSTKDTMFLVGAGLNSEQVEKIQELVMKWRRVSKENK